MPYAKGSFTYEQRSAVKLWPRASTALSLAQSPWVKNEGENGAYLLSLGWGWNESAWAQGSTGIQQNHAASKTRLIRVFPQFALTFRAAATFVSHGFLIKVYNSLLCIRLWGWNEETHTQTRSFGMGWLLPTRTAWTLKRDNSLLCARPHSKHSTGSLHLHSHLGGNITSNPILQTRKRKPRKVEKNSTFPRVRSLESPGQNGLQTKL